MSEAADRLKHRLNTGTLGGDQDSRDVEQVIADLAQKTRECDALEEIHRGHVEGTLCEKIEAERNTLKAQVEQLGRQVAERSKTARVSGACAGVGTEDVQGSDRTMELN